MKSQTAINTFVEETGGYVAAQLEACTRCGMCAEACHFYQGTGNPEYAPVWKIELLRRAYEQRFTLSGKAKLALHIESRSATTTSHTGARSITMRARCATSVRWSARWVSTSVR